MPNVSVIIPAYNNAAYLAEAIDSVLSQTYRSLELIVVDDGSTDETRDVVRTYQERDNRVRYLFQSNRGPSAARNYGMREARGKYIAFIDADDVWMPPKLQQQVAAISRDKSIGFVYCDTVFVDRARRVIRDYVRKIRLVSGDIAFDLFNDFFLITSAVVIRASCCGTAGYFREDMRVGEDYEYFLKLAYRYRGAVVGEKLMIRRVRSDSLSRQDAVADASADIRTLTEFAAANPGFRMQYRRGIARRLSAYHCALGYLYMNRGRHAWALRHQVRSLRYRPTPVAFRRLMLSFVPLRLLSLARRRLGRGDQDAARAVAGKSNELLSKE
jgi:glycosyltransferase involved in cell wall biosynthesis